MAASLKPVTNLGEARGNKFSAVVVRPGRDESHLRSVVIAHRTIGCTLGMEPHQPDLRDTTNSAWSSETAILISMERVRTTRSELIVLMERLRGFAWLTFLAGFSFGAGAMLLLLDVPEDASCGWFYERDRRRGTSITYTCRATVNGEASPSMRAKASSNYLERLARGPPGGDAEEGTCNGDKQRDDPIVARDRAAQGRLGGGGPRTLQRLAEAQEVKSHRVRVAR